MKILDIPLAGNHPGFFTQNLGNNYKLQMVDFLLLIVLGPKKMDTKITYRHQTVFLSEIVCFQ